MTMTGRGNGAGTGYGQSVVAVRCRPLLLQQAVTVIAVPSASPTMSGKTIRWINAGSPASPRPISFRWTRACVNFKRVVLLYVPRHEYMIAQHPTCPLPLATAATLPRQACHERTRERRGSLTRSRRCGAKAKAPHPSQLIAIMSSVTLTLDMDFAYVILGVTGIALHYFTSSRYIMPLRKKYGIKYPDMGNGIYAQKLDEKKWIEFNNAQRVHYNYLEQLPIALPLALFSGLFQAKFTAAGCLSYILGRELYMRGYMTKGPDGRYRGAPFLYPAMIAWLGITVHGAAKMLGWF